MLKHYRPLLFSSSPLLLFSALNSPANRAIMPMLSTPVSARDFHQGDLSAPIQLVHFGDFECPYSGALVSTVKELQAEAGANLLYVFRPFPLADVHPHALVAARAAWAASEQEKFWPMYDALFQNQNALGPTFLKSYAEQIGLDVARFETDFRSQKHDAQIEEGIRDAHSSGAHGTPTLFINGQFHDNDERLWKIERLREAIRVGSQ